MGEYEIDLKEIGQKSVHWINVAQDTDKWWAVVSLVMNLLFHRISSLAEDITSLLQELCAME
jgi:hypothetical protein